MTKNLKAVLEDHGAEYEGGTWTVEAENGSMLAIDARITDKAFRQLAGSFDEDEYILKRLERRTGSIYELAEDARWMKEELEGIIDDLDAM